MRLLLWPIRGGINGITISEAKQDWQCLFAYFCGYRRAEPIAKVVGKTKMKRSGYEIEFINGKVLRINADGYDICHHGTIANFYLAPEDRSSKICLYKIPFANVLYIIETSELLRADNE